MTDSIIPISGRYEPDYSDGGCVGGTVASKYSEETKASAIQQILSEGRPPKAVAEAFGVSLATLRRWLKDAPSPALPARTRLVILDTDLIREKLARILHNEGFAPQIEPLRGHALLAATPGLPEWLECAWLFDLPPAGAQRLVDLIDRSGKDVPIACLDAVTAPCIGETPDCELLANPVTAMPAVLLAALHRLYARKRQRAHLRECQQHFEQLQRCCLSAFDNTPNPIAIVRAGGHIYANPAYQRLFLVDDFAALQEASLDSLLAEPDRAPFAQSFEATLNMGHATVAEITLRNGLRVRAALECFPGTSRGVQVILQPYIQAPSLVATKKNAPEPADEVAEAAPLHCVDDGQALWEERIRRALRERHLFSIVYQPIVNLGGAADACYEALLRLHDEQGGEYLPASFLPAAERASLMGVIDQWVIRQAASQVQSEWAAGRVVRVFVNLSRETLLNTDFSAWLARLMEHMRIAPEAFVFEVPESVLMLHQLQCRTMLHELRALGCGIALDHFDGGSDVFTLLQDIDVDYLKFSAALTRGLADNREIHLRVRDLAGRARALKMKTIVGRVQDARSVALLWQTGVDYVQGYFLQQPSKALDYDFVNGDYEVTTSNQSVF